MGTFPVTELNRVRKSIRADYDKDAVFRILDEGFLAHVGFVDNDRPIVIPMIYGRIDDRLYLHGARAARFADVMGPGVPVCVTVTLVDAIVVARSAFHSSMNYRSVVIHGAAKLVTDDRERERAVVAVTDHMMPGRWDEARAMTQKELGATAVIGLTIENASAKSRAGEPVDDEEDYALPVWGGLVPVRTAFGPAEADSRLKTGTPVPESVRRLMNGRGR